MEKISAQHERFQNDFPDAAASTTSTNFRTRRDRTISRLFRRVMIAVCLCLATYVVLKRCSISSPNAPASLSEVVHSTDFGTKRPNGGYDIGVSTASSNRVPLEAHIMSKCPDAQDCLQQLIVPAMEQISDKVDFHLSFIGSVSNKTSEVECKHGPAECIGDMLILCAAHLPFPARENSLSSLSYPHTPIIRSLGFANCLISSYQQIPERRLVEQCALEHGIDFDALNKCASQQEDKDPSEDGDDDTPPSGIALLRKSALHSDELGVTKSCTVRLDESVWCIRDGGVWKDCAKNGEASKVSVLVEEVGKLYKERN